MKPTYSLKEAKRLLRSSDKYRINSDVVSDALRDFGWTEKDIKAAFLLLIQAEKPMGHFHKTQLSDKLPGVMFDFYKARDIKGESVYLHFYIRDGFLVINSFKKW